MGRVRRAVPALTLVALSLTLPACGGSGGAQKNEADRDASFPAVEGRTLAAILADAGGEQSEQLVLAPGGSVFRPGKGRYGFGLFTVGGEVVGNAELALYVARGAEGKARGPFPARRLDLRTEPRYRSKTSEHDAEFAFAAELALSGTGEHRIGALVRRGGKLLAAGPISVSVGEYKQVPSVGGMAPRVSTPTAREVADLAEIDTRQPPSSMHDEDLADALGAKPVVLIFATPALCQSRVCGPVVDIAEQVKQRGGHDDVAFIHMEIYKRNDANAGVRKQVSAYGLPSEPWLFVIDRNGRVSTAIEGAFSATELEEALEKVG